MESPSVNMKVIIVLLGLMGLILVGWALMQTYTVTMPLIFSFFLALLLFPVENNIRTRAPVGLKWLGLLASTLLVVLVVTGLGFVIYLAADRVAEKGPEYADKLQNVWREFAAWTTSMGLYLPQEFSDIQGLRDKAASAATYVLGGVWSLLILWVLIFFFTLLMLLESCSWRDRVRAAWPGGRSETIIHTVTGIAHAVRQYLLVRTFVSALSALTASLLLWWLNVDFVLLWAVLIFALNYVPNIGSIIAVIPPTLVALLNEGTGHGALVLLLLTINEQVIGNLIDPLMQGRRLEISPVVILLSVVFWSLIWGPAGALLAVPITATIIIACMHIKLLEPVAVLMSRTGNRDRLYGQTHFREAQAA